MTYTLTNHWLPASQYPLKAPYAMSPAGIVVHNTAGTASAREEAAAMIASTAATSFHVVIDEAEAVECIPFARNAWHAGDGAAGYANRHLIGLEIARSMDTTSDRFDQAEANAALYIAHVCRQYGWTSAQLHQHNWYSSTACPHRTKTHWQTFLAQVDQCIAELEGGASEGAGSTAGANNGGTSGGGANDGATSGENDASAGAGAGGTVGANSGGASEGAGDGGTSGADGASEGGGSTADANDGGTSGGGASDGAQNDGAGSTAGANSADGAGEGAESTAGAGSEGSGDAGAQNEGGGSTAGANSGGTGGEDDASEGGGSTAGANNEGAESAAGTNADAPTITILCDGHPLTLRGHNENGTIYTSLRDLATALGHTVRWENGIAVVEK